MRKNLPLLIFLLLEVLLAVFFLVPSLRTTVEGISFLTSIWNTLKSIADLTNKIFTLDKVLVNVSSRLYYFIGLCIFNAILIVLYKIIVVILSFLLRRFRRKKLVSNHLGLYILTEEEKAQFEWKLYLKKVPIFGILSFIIPLGIEFLFVIIRFDRTICENDINRDGYFSIYNDSILPFIKTLSVDLANFVNTEITRYILTINDIINIVNIKWIEYGFIAIIFVIILFVWYFFVWIFVKLFRIPFAKRRARRAKKRYIDKMENAELKARKKAGSRISSKAHDILGDLDIELPVYEDDASSISIVSDVTSIDSAYKEKVSSYIDDISTGVIDLGLASTTEEEDKEPIEKRIPIFVDDEDVDIVLDKEPVIEVLEEESDEFEEELPFFEKYSPDFFDDDCINEEYAYSQETVLEEEQEVEHEEVNFGIHEETEEELMNNSEVILNENYKNEFKDTLSNNNYDNGEVEEYLGNVEEIEIDNSLEKEFSKEEYKSLLPFKKDSKINTKKNIKPISLKSRFEENERFKNPKSKYLNYPLTNKKDDKEKAKKRNLKRRKHNK